MALNIYNTLTRRLEIFKPLEANRVNMYCCGITVYDYCHLGHARTCMVWDVVRRYLQWTGYEVTYVQNFTDIDDKILKRASSEESTMEEVADRFIKAYYEDMDRLNIGRADAYPRATHTLDGIKNLISELEHKGYAYCCGGDVYYAVTKFQDYGKLSGRKLEDLQAGASGRMDDPDYHKKKDPFDFALWKSAKPGEPSWCSPWGQGRPGWHIECSAMVKERLGETIDLHMGGGDLIFPHHENEIAQSEAVTGKPLANYWLHNGMVKVNGEKMSKSLGNFITIRELLDRPVEPMALRLFILTAHYRKPLDFTDEALVAATNGWHTLREALLWGYELGWSVEEEVDVTIANRFKEAMDEDFNFAEAVAIIFELAKGLNKERHILVHQGRTTTPTPQLQLQWRTIVDLSQVLGFKVDVQEKPTVAGISDEDVDRLIEDRRWAREAKNYAEGDRIRDYLKSQGIILIDQSKGVTIWHR